MDKENRMKRLKQGIVIILCCSLMIGMTACGKFDAKGYVQALLDHRFQGDTEKLLKFDKDSEAKKLKEDYEQYIQTFSQGLTEGLNASGEMEVYRVRTTDEPGGFRTSGLCRGRIPAGRV